MVKKYLNNLLGHFSSDLAMDLGTANTLIYIKEKGIRVKHSTRKGE